MSKQIGVLTYHHTTNFGSLLQTYGLVKKINDLGYNCEVIDYYNEAVEKRERPRKLTDSLDPRHIRDYFIYEPFKKRKSKEFEYFLKEKTHLSEQHYRRENIKEANLVYDTYIVGSDLVWDDTINNSDRTYMLDFASDDKHKFAYASSSGQLWNNNVEEVSKLLNRFDIISVREKEISDALKEMVDIPVNFVCDPTMLLDRKQWADMACDRVISEKYVLIYFTDDELKIYEDAIRYGMDNGIPVYAISYGWLPEGIKPIRPTKIEEFLSLIEHAEVVFSASYHGMLFSLYFNKQFFYYNRGWKSRMRSIAEYLEITDREHYNPAVNKTIDYIRVNELVDSFRDESLEILRTYLN